MKKIITASLILIAACNTKPLKITVSTTLLDSIKKVTDTTFTKKYRTDDFATATYFINKKDSTVFQIMYNKDSAITQILGAKKDIKFLEQNFYNNGQLKAAIGFDSYGNKSGKAVYYLENGDVDRISIFKNGFAE